VVTNSDACQLWLSADPPNMARARVSADRIARDAKDAANIVTRIRELFAKKPPRKEPISFNEIIEDLALITRKKYSARDLVISLDLDANIPLVDADRIQIHQLIFNLLRNGVEAMRSNGEEPVTLVIRSRLAENNIIVEVSDNGLGLPDPLKVFEPFFTTKSDGMGMGLSICRSIVVAHSGRLWAEARPSRGAVFAFELPIHDRA